VFLKLENPLELIARKIGEMSLRLSSENINVNRFGGSICLASLLELLLSVLAKMMELAMLMRQVRLLNILQELYLKKGENDEQDYCV
jgi:hypothetical protein